MARRQKPGPKPVDGIPKEKRAVTLSHEAVVIVEAKASREGRTFSAALDRIVVESK